jgi:hypothetical protein
MNGPDEDQAGTEAVNLSFDVAPEPLLLPAGNGWVYVVHASQDGWHFSLQLK